MFRWELCNTTSNFHAVVVLPICFLGYFDARPKPTISTLHRIKADFVALCNIFPLYSRFTKNQPQGAGGLTKYRTAQELMNAEPFTAFPAARIYCCLIQHAVAGCLRRKASARPGGHEGACERGYS